MYIDKTLPSSLKVDDECLSSFCLGKDSWVAEVPSDAEDSWVIVETWGVDDPSDVEDPSSTSFVFETFCTCGFDLSTVSVCTRNYC